MTKRERPTEYKKIILWIASLMAIVLVCFLAFFINDYVENKQLVMETPPTVESVYGLPEGRTLSQEVLEVTDEFVYFEDRALTRYAYDSATVSEYSTSVNDFVGLLPQELDFYYVAVPSSIQFDEVGKQYSDDQAAAIGELYSQLDESVKTVDIIPILEENKDEYIYFRFDNSWTSDGAYYGAQEILSAMGKTITPKTEENYFSGYILDYYGGDKYIKHYDIESRMLDTVNYHLPREGVNNQYVTVESTTFGEISYETPTVAASRQGTDIFLEGVIDYSILDGDGEGTLIIVGDQTSKIAAPWFTPNFERIVVIMEKNVNDGSRVLQMAIEEFSAQSLIYIESIIDIAEGQTINTNRLMYDGTMSSYGGYSSETPIAADAEYVYYEDRVLDRFYTDSSTISDCASITNTFLYSLPADMNKTMMLIPSLIAFDVNSEEYSYDQSSAIEQFYAYLTDKGATINLMDVYSPLIEEEYIYFRTDDSYTLDGAYFAAKEYLSMQGTQILDKDSAAYTSDYKYNFSGLNANIAGYEIPSIYDDVLKYYIPSGGVATQVIRTYDGTEYVTETSPIIDSTRGGTDEFIGGYYSHSIIQGEGEEPLMIVGSSQAKMFATWMVPYYSEIILVSSDFYEGDALSFKNLLAEHDPKELLLLMDIASLETGSTYGQLLKFYDSPST